MEGDDIIFNQLISLSLPFSNCSDAQIEFEFLGDKKTLYEKYSCSKFFKDMSAYVNTISPDNYTCNYYDINNFNSKFTKPNSSYLKVCHINIRSINLHKHELLSFLKCLKYTFDIILLTECGHALKPNIEECFDEYDFFLKPPKSTKGGAGILVRKNIFDSIEIINSNLAYDCSCSKCAMESLWLRLSLKNEKITIGCIYIDTRTEFRTLQQSVFNFLTKFR